MIDTSRCISMILERNAAFQPIWEAHVTRWEGEELSLCNAMSAFSRYVKDMLTSRHTDHLPEIFDLIEEFMVYGDDDVQTATATCFLENIMNVTPDQIDPDLFVPLLKPESRTYCKAWNDFTGVLTKGLES